MIPILTFAEWDLRMGLPPAFFIIFKMFGETVHILGIPLPLGLVSPISEIHTQYHEYFQVPIVIFRDHFVELSHTIIHFYQVELRAVNLLVSVFTHVYRSVKSLFTILWEMSS